jgi:hypothetical protein|tara:strand:+ start:489 stop:707 length:219 start_codon:yes stop_codon:yes gene_type:complete
MKLNQEKEVTKWTTMAIRRGVMDSLNLLANYEHRTAGEMVAVMMRGYQENVAKDMDMTVDELKTFLNNYERD